MGEKIYNDIDNFYTLCFRYHSAKEMAEKESISIHTVYRNLDKLKEIDLKKREEVRKYWFQFVERPNYVPNYKRTTYDFNDYAFHHFTPNGVYWLGMIASDGCIHKNRNKISINAKYEDKAHIDAFAKFLNYTGEVKERLADCKGKKFPSVYLEFFSKIMKDRLLELGIQPKKSNKDIDYFCYIPDEFKLYFLFGYFDGDGSLLISERLRIEIIGNYSFLYSVKKFLENEYYIKSDISCRKKNDCATKYELKIRQVYSLYLFCQLYINFREKCLLERKYKKMKEAFLLLKDKVEKNDNLKYHSGYYIDIRKKQDISNRIREKKKVCKNCGKLICDNAEYCVDCYNLNRRVVERPSREVLKYEIRNYPFIKLSEKYGVSDNAIRKWCKFYNLPYKSTIIKNISDKDWLNI